MTEYGGSLTRSGLTLGLIGATIALIMIILSFLGLSSYVVDYTLLNTWLAPDDVVGLIIRIFLIFMLYFICIGRIDIDELFILGLVVLILGILIGTTGGFFAALGGIIIILDAIF